MDKKKSHASFYYIFLVEIHRFLELTPSLLEHNHVRQFKSPTFKKKQAEQQERQQ